MTRSTLLTKWFALQIRKIRKTKNFQLAMFVYRTFDAFLSSLSRIQGLIERALGRTLPTRVIRVHGVRSRGYGGGLLRLSTFAQHFSHVAVPHSQGAYSVTSGPDEIDSLYIIENNPQWRLEMLKFATSSQAKTIFFGSEDCTFPRQTDVRWKSFSDSEIADFRKVINTSHASWFVENLDTPFQGVEAIPGGLLGNGPMQTWRVVKEGEFEEKRHNGKLVLISHRIRSDPQYDSRRKVTGLGEDTWSTFSHVIRPVEDENLTGTEMDIIEWRKLAKQFSFVACVEGGGLSPSPKFFDVLVGKSIPIIKESAISPVHELLPCVVVPAWEDKALTEDFLLQKLDEIRGRWKNWSSVFERLTDKFWAEYVFSRNTR